MNYDYETVKYLVSIGIWLIDIFVIILVVAVVLDIFKAMTSEDTTMREVMQRMKNRIFAGAIGLTAALFITSVWKFF